MPGSLSPQCCDGRDGWVAGSAVVRIVEWNIFLLVAECMVE